MQDINDENEPDLQSVFQKISESLKTINQEAIENETSIEKNCNDNTKTPEQIEEKQQQEITHVNNEILNENTSGVNHSKPPDKKDENYLKLEKLNGVDVLITEETSLKVTDLIEKEVNAPIINGEVIEKSIQETTSKNKEKSKSPQNVFLEEDCKEIEDNNHENVKDSEIIHEKSVEISKIVSDEQINKNDNKVNDLHLQKPNTSEATEPEVNSPLETIVENGEILSDNSKSNSLSAFDIEIESEREVNSKSTNDGVCTLEMVDNIESDDKIQKKILINKDVAASNDSVCVVENVDSSESTENTQNKIINNVEDVMPMDIDTEIEEHDENTNKENSEVLILQSEEEKNSKEISKVSILDSEEEKLAEQMDEVVLAEEEKLLLENEEKSTRKEDEELLLEKEDDKCTSETSHKVEEQTILDSELIPESKKDEISSEITEVGKENDKGEINVSQKGECTLSKLHKENDEVILESVTNKVSIDESSGENSKALLDSFSEDIISESSKENDKCAFVSDSNKIPILESNEESSKENSKCAFVSDSNKIPILESSEESSKEKDKCAFVSDLNKIPILESNEDNKLVLDASNAISMSELSDKDETVLRSSSKDILISDSSEEKDKNVLDNNSKEEESILLENSKKDSVVLDSDSEAGNKIDESEMEANAESPVVRENKLENEKDSEIEGKTKSAVTKETELKNEKYSEMEANTKSDVIKEMEINAESPVVRENELENEKEKLDNEINEKTSKESESENENHQSDNLIIEEKCTEPEKENLVEEESMEPLIIEEECEEIAENSVIVEECKKPDSENEKLNLNDVVIEEELKETETENKSENSDNVITVEEDCKEGESKNEGQKIEEECKEPESQNKKHKLDNEINAEQSKELERENKKHKSNLVLEECKKSELENELEEQLSDSNSVGNLVMEIDENDTGIENTSEVCKLDEETNSKKEKEQTEEGEKSELIEISADESMIIDLDSEEENIILNESNELENNKLNTIEDGDKMDVDDDNNELEINETNNEANSENLINQTKETAKEDNEKPDEIIDDSNIDGKSNDLIIDLEEDEDGNDLKLSETLEENKDSNELVENVEKEVKSSEDSPVDSAPTNEDKEQTEEIDESNEVFELMEVENDEDQILNENVESNEKDESSKMDDIIEDETEAIETEESKLENEMMENMDKTEKHIFYNKECVNYECDKNCKIFYISPIFILNFYKITIKANTTQFVCDTCFDIAVDKYEEWCNILESHQPLLLTKVPQKQSDLVEILDSSDEDEASGSQKEEKPSDFDDKTIDLIKNELDDVISSVFARTEIQNQLTWSKTLLEHRIAKLQEDSAWIDETLSSLQKNADKMNNALYQCPKIEMKILAPLDLNSGKQFVLGESTQASQLTIPPIGEIFRPAVLVGLEYFAAKNKVIASWLPSTVVEIVEPPPHEKDRSMKYYKVKFSKIKLLTYKSVPAKHLAYVDVPKVQLSIGTRVIALFDASTLYKTKESQGPDIRSAFYPGVIAEALQPYNNYRYLIFFDDGYTQYVHHRDVRLICEVSTNVWDDIHPGSRDFIQNYLINYKKNRPMVQVKKGQSMITELNGKWIYAKVVDVDASLIQMLFEGQKNHTEWIYRGSTRLGPLFKAIQKTNIPQVTRLPRRSEPFVRYMQDDENCKQQQNNAQQNNQPSNESAQNKDQIRSQVAKKSTSATPRVQESQDLAIPSAGVKHLNNSTIFVDDEEPKGTLIYYSSKSENNPPPKPFKPHSCGPHCITREHFEGHYGVLSKPLLNSWERSVYKIKSKKTSIVYRTPCGRNLRSIEEVHKYLRLTRNELNVENFVFDPDVGCLNEYQVKKCIVNKADITEGREKIPIQCVNYYDHTMPPDCEYSADRIPTEGVNLNTDPEYLVGCDCKDDCTDKFKCSCWKLTLEGARYGNPHTPIENIGYYYKRLLEPVTTGIYECNSRCKCSKKCINRVVQHSLETKLQVFKTSNRGWGLRCINDVPKGAFICIYAGNLLTEQKANECGDGDEYFAELDYIEVAERLKEGYESDVNDDVDSDDYVPDDRDSDEEFNSRASYNTGLVNTRNRASAKRSNSNTTNGTNDEDDEQERQAINFVPNTQLENYEEIQPKYKSMRRLFGKNEYCYIMDAKSIGNVGRYFNHSCSPNLFVQNVFVDTHDLRFPWVAFFALSNIRAGTELTWNYNYEVGVVPGKVLFCQCGAANCRGRLL